MKKGMIFLVLIAAILLCSISAYAFVSGIFHFGGGQLGQGNWDLQAGGKPYMAIGNGGVYSPAVSSISIATHAVSVEPNGSYTCTFKFRINDLNSDVLVGIGSSSGQTLAGYNGGEFMIGNSGMGGSASGSAEYTVQFTSIDDNSFNVRISGSGVDAARTISGSLPTSVIMRITNESDVSGPVITSATFTATAAPTTSPSTSPQPPSDNTSTVTPSTQPPSDNTSTVTPSPTTGSTYNPEIMDWYATYYEPPVLSNQSYIYNEDGQLVDIVSGMPGHTVVSAAEPLNMTAPAVGNVTAQAGNVSTNVTKNSTIPTALAEATATAAPTKTQSPGFGVILAAISMAAAVLYFSRKK